MSPNDTIEERLRDTLADVADSTQLSPDAWSQVERRAERRRHARPVLAVAAAAGVAAIATAAVLLVDRDDSGPEIATGGDRALSCRVAPPADVAVTLEPGATTAQVEAVERLLADHPEVSDSSFQSQEEGARIFRCVYADQPEILNQADLTRMPSVFLVDLAADASPRGLIEEIEEQTDATAAPGNCYPLADLEVFMVVAATTEDVEAARTTIERAPGVSDVTFVSEDNAYREFACQFVTQPDLLAATTPDSLPQSFRVTLRPGADHRTLLQQFQALAGVDSAIDTRYSVVVPIPGFEGDEIGPSSTGYTEIATGTAADGSPWKLLVRTEENGAYSALAEFPDSEVILDGVETGGDFTEDVVTGANGATLGSAPADAARVRIETEGTVPIEVATISAPGIRARFFVTRLLVGPTATLVVLDEDGNELYRIRTIDGDWTTQP